jgi:hypothetical protein
MSQNVDHAPNAEAPASPKDARGTTIRAVQTPLGLFVLVVMLVEVVLGLVASTSTGNDRTCLIVCMSVTLLLVVFIVSGMAVFRPRSLYGVPMEVLVRQNAQHADPADGTRTAIVRPRVFVGSSPSLARHFPETKNIIHNAFPHSAMMFVKDLTAKEFRQTLTDHQIDIVQLSVVVLSDGSLEFSDGCVPALGVRQLLEHCGARLIILAACNSVPLAAALAGRVNMIAATGTLRAFPNDMRGSIADAHFRQMGGDFNEWNRVFFSLLSSSVPLAQAYSIAGASIRTPLAIIMHSNLVFEK